MFIQCVNSLHQTVVISTMFSSCLTASVLQPAMTVFTVCRIKRLITSFFGRDTDLQVVEVFNHANEVWWIILLCQYTVRWALLAMWNPCFQTLYKGTISSQFNTKIWIGWLTHCRFGWFSCGIFLVSPHSMSVRERRGCIMVSLHLL